MAKELYEAYPVFKASLDSAAEVLNPLLDAPLLEILFSEDEADERINQTANSQPGLFAIEYALYTFLKAYGIIPNVLRNLIIM